MASELEVRPMWGNFSSSLKEADQKLRSIESDAIDIGQAAPTIDEKWLHFFSYGLAGALLLGFGSSNEGCWVG
jgi:hypothetical protein